MSGDTIVQIPYEGGSGRVPTGAMQFLEDWPGLFVRGDDAVVLLHEIEAVLEHLRESKKPMMTLKLEEVAEIIRARVILSSGESAK